MRFPPEPAESLRGTASGSGTNCRRFALPAGGVTGLSAAKAAVLMKGLGL